jgi:glucose/arabinose dehydrogenase
MTFRQVAGIFPAAISLFLVQPLPAQPPATQKTEDYVLNIETLAILSGQPWSIAFFDKNRALVTEKSGLLRVMEHGKILPDPVRNTPRVNSGGQGGLLGVAIDPEWPKESWVYLSYSHSPNDATNGPAMTRIVRGKIVDNAWTEQQVLWESKPEHYREAGVHFGCRIAFDKAGHLYFSMGDRGAQNQAQDPTRPNGKTFRINRDGTIPKDNPFLSNPAAYPAMFSLGNRNPQGLAIHPATDQLWATEHGPRGGDELNLILPGRNYGWPVITYGINYSGTKISDFTHKDGMEQPVIQWTPSPGMCGLTFVTGDLFPKWRHNLLAGALVGQHIKRIVVDGAKATHQEIVLSGRGRIRDVVCGPDGAIYVLTEGPNRILRLTPAP